jgi:tetratricopeptide (TPR) repeat protein
MDKIRGPIRAVCLLAALAFTGVPAFAAEEPAGTDAAVQTAPSVEDLLDKLSKSTSEDEAKALEKRIVAAWNDSGSDTVDLFIARAGAAIEARNFGVALKYLDTVVYMQPDFAEGWNMRATVYYLLDEYELSLADIRQVLALQPRHFGALSGLGMIFRELDEPDKALEAFREVLQVHPYFGKARESVDKLSVEVEGRDI